MRNVYHKNEFQMSQKTFRVKMFTVKCSCYFLTVNQMKRKLNIIDVIGNQEITSALLRKSFVQASAILRFTVGIHSHNC